MIIYLYTKRWYNDCILNKNNPQKCFQCKSKLILISRVTEKIAGSLFPQTTSIYRCSNKACQDLKDQDEEKRIQFRKNKELVDQKRAKEKLSEKKRMKKVLR